MMWLQALQTYPLLAVGVAGLIGLLVGSFLNVVIYRLPKMIEREETQAIRNVLHERNLPVPDALPVIEDRFNLAVPASRCGCCGQPLRARDNIPVISYVFLRGRCSRCACTISPRYPLVEIFTAIATASAIAYFGPTLQGLAAVLLSWCLICLTLIDLDTFLLPDSITLPLLWLGLILNYYGTFTDFSSAFWGAIWGYLALWSVYQFFKWVFHKEGMGFGDFKLLAALGAWLGWQLLPQIILLSAVVGAAVGLWMIVRRGHDQQVPIPFGPYLAVAGAIALYFGPEINAAYLGYLQ